MEGRVDLKVDSPRTFQVQKNIRRARYYKHYPAKV